MLPRVLLLSTDAILSDLLLWNLSRRGWAVEQAWSDPCTRTVAGATTPDAPDLVIADLDCMSPAVWNAVAGLRAAFPDTPLLLLGHEWIDGTRLQRWRPCSYLRKPLAIDTLLSHVRAMAPARV
jgi:DNA-binding response OmpR family regulator